MTYRVFISQPMSGRPVEEIKAERENICTIMNQLANGIRHTGTKVIVVDSFDEEAFLSGKNPVECLADSIKILSTCNLVVFAPGWEKSRGCRVEHQIATDYCIATVVLTDTKPYTAKQKPDTEA